jgi:hypothetical protein
MENHAPAPRNAFPMIRSSLFFLSIVSLNGGEELEKAMATSADGSMGNLPSKRSTSKCAKLKNQD